MEKVDFFHLIDALRNFFGNDDNFKLVVERMGLEKGHADEFYRLCHNICGDLGNLNGFVRNQEKVLECIEVDLKHGIFGGKESISVREKD
jgi:hypothetical protein